MATSKAKWIRLVEGFISHEAVEKKKKACTKAVNNPLFSTVSLNSNTLVTKLLTMKSTNSDHVCSHDLPTKGFCTLSRIHGERKKLFLQSLSPSESNDKSPSTSLLFKFQTIEDLLEWEQKLRSHFQVYSYTITDVTGLQDEPVSCCTLHITSVYIAFTNYDTKDGLKCIARHTARGVDLQFIILQNRNVSLEITAHNGVHHKYIFKADHEASIRKAFEIFHKVNNRNYQSLSSSNNNDVNHDRYTGIYKAPSPVHKFHSGNSNASNGNPAGSNSQYLDLEKLILNGEESIDSKPQPIKSIGLKQGRTRKEPTENIDTEQSYINHYKKTIPSTPNLYCYINDDSIDFNRKDDSPSGLSIVRVGGKSELESTTHRYPHWQPSNQSMIQQKESEKQEKNGTVTKQHDIGLTICVMASEAVSTEFWVIGVLITRRQDEDLMKKLVDIEKEAGRHMVTNKIPLEADADIQLAFQKCPEGFQELSNAMQVVQLEDLRKLSSNLWLVVEFHFHHEDSQQTKFISLLNIKPNNNSAEASRFKKHDVRICQMFKNDKVKEAIAKKEELRTKIRDIDSQKSTNPEECVLFRLANDKSIFCQKLDQFHPLGHDWKAFASQLGLNKEAVQHISESRGAYMEQVLLVLQTSCSSDCTSERFQEIAINLNRKDLLPFLT